MKYVYCLTSAEEREETFPTGLGGGEVQWIGTGAINTLVSELGAEPLLVNPQNVLDHQKVVQAAMTRFQSVIPCRFGTRFYDMEELLSLLEDHAALIEAKLIMLMKKVEVGIQALFSAILTEPVHRSGTEEHTDGTTYLIQKRRQHEIFKTLSKQADQFTHALNTATTPWWANVTTQKRTADQELVLGLYYLVEQAQLASFKQAYTQFRQHIFPIKLLYTGPWPPYTFANIDLHPREK